VFKLPDDSEGKVRGQPGSEVRALQGHTLCSEPPTTYNQPAAVRSTMQYETVISIRLAVC